MRIAKLIQVVAGVMALSSCTAMEAPSPAVCAIDTAKVMPWGAYHTASETPGPSVFVYEGCGKRLVYVAAQHANDPKSETYAQVRTAMKRWPPGFLVLEGFPESMGVSPDGMISHALSVAGGPMDAEPYEAIRRGIVEGAAFSGGEPDDRDILAAMEDQGLTVVDLVGFYALRQIDQWKREQRIADHRDPKLDGLIRDLALSTGKSIGMELGRPADGASLASFVAWYEGVNGIGFDAGYRPEDSHPSGPGQNRPSNLLSDLVSDTRDVHIIGVISAALERNPRVLVVYGGSHHTIQAPALEAAFGAPRFAGRLP